MGASESESGSYLSGFLAFARVASTAGEYGFDTSVWNETPDHGVAYEALLHLVGLGPSKPSIEQRLATEAKERKAAFQSLARVVRDCVRQVNSQRAEIRSLQERLEQLESQRGLVRLSADVDALVDKWAMLVAELDGLLKAGFSGRAIGGVEETCDPETGECAHYYVVRTRLDVDLASRLFDAFAFQCAALPDVAAGRLRLALDFE